MKAPKTHEPTVVAVIRCRANRWNVAIIRSGGWKCGCVTMQKTRSVECIRPNAALNLAGLVSTASRVRTSENGDAPPPAMLPATTKPENGPTAPPMPEMA